MLRGQRQCAALENAVRERESALDTRTCQCPAVDGRRRSAQAGECMMDADAPTTTAQSAAVAREVTRNDVVLHDLPCAGCGYNVRSIPLDAVCPECGLAVARSLGRDNALWEARPAWLRSLSWGVWLMIAAQVLLAGAWLSAFYLELRIDDPRVVLGGLLFVCFVYAAGTWLLTRRERLFVRHSGGRRLRWTARLGAFGPVISVGLALWFVVQNLPVQSESLAAVILFIPVALIVPGILATFLYLRGLARRVLSRRMSEYATIVAVGGTITAGVIMTLIALAYFDVDVDIDNDVGFVAFLAIAVALFLFYLWSLLILFLFAIAFARASRAARKLWQQHAA